MTRLPTPGSDNGQWGQILNDYLAQSHASDGNLKDAVVGTSQLADSAVTAAKILDGTIPAAKLTSATQTSLTKADARVQSVNAVFPSSGNVTLAAADVGAIATTAKGAASGVATLDGTGKLTAAELPSAVLNASSTPAQAPGVTWACNVKDGAYGAKGDGTTNDTAAIQAAINAASTAGGGVVFIPRGVYQIGPITLPSNVHLVGDGATRTSAYGVTRGTVLRARTSTATVGTTFTGTTNGTTTVSAVSSFTGLNVGMPVTSSGNISGGTYIAAMNTGAGTITLSQAAISSTTATITPWGPLVNTAGSNYASISRIAFDSGVGQTANAMQGVSDCTGAFASFLRIEDCYFNSFGGQNICHTGEVSYFVRNRADNTNLHNIHILNTASTGGSAPASDNFILFNESGGASGNGSAPGAFGSALCIEYAGFNTVIGNQFYNFAIGIQVLSSVGNRIEGNRLEKHDFYGINLDQITGANPSSSNVVIGNYCFNNGYVSGGRGIRLSGSAVNNTVVGNHIANIASAPGGTNTLTGIGLAGSATRNRIAQNYISNVVQNGIALSTASYNSIEGNTIDTCGSEGIIVQTSSNENTFSNNHIYNAGQTTSNTYDGMAITGGNNNFINGLKVVTPATNKVKNGLQIIAGVTGTHVTNGYCVSGNYGSNSILDAGTSTTIRGWRGYTVGSVTVSVPASGSAVASAAYDRTFYITTGAGTTSIAIGSGSSFTLNASALNIVNVPAGSTLTATYTNAPTWVVYGNAA